MSQTTYTLFGVTATVADAERVAAWVKSLPQTQKGLADFQWNTNVSSNGPATGLATFVAYRFARILGLFEFVGPTDAVGNVTGQSTGGANSFMYPDLFVGPVVLSTDEDR